MPYRNVVVGTDGSETAAVALEKAAAIAEMSGGEVIILHAYRRMPAIGDVSAAVAVPDPFRHGPGRKGFTGPRAKAGERSAL